MIEPLVRALSRPLIHRTITGRMRYVSGLHNIPRTGPVVIVANHASYIDHFFIMTVLHALRGDRVWYPTKQESFQDTGKRIWHQAWYCYPVDRAAPSQEIFDKAQTILDRGEVLVLYPEGTRGDGSGLLPFKTGAFRMALAANAPVVPIGMSNLHNVLPKGSTAISDEFGTLVVGEPIPVPLGVDPRATVSQLRDTAREAVESLIDKGARAGAAEQAIAAQEAAALTDAIITGSLTVEGALPREAITRLRLLVTLGRTNLRPRSELDIQQTRLAGFRALQAPPIIRSLALALVNRKAVSIARSERDHGFANYLAARTSAGLPAFLGGSSRRSREFYRTAAAADTGLASKAYVGIAESHIKDGNADDALASLAEADSHISENDPRGELRRERIGHLRHRVTQGVS